MCGRFTLRTPLHQLAEQFHAEPAPLLDLAVRYNVAPTQSIAVVRAVGGHRELTTMRWGLIPSWAKDAKIAYSTINARGDTLATKPAYRSAFKKRRCLVLADGYYEWSKTGRPKQPYLYELAGGRPFALAGLWEQWWGGAKPETNGDRSPLETCTIVTTDANALARQIHDRMPVILEESDYAEWLDPENQDGASLQNLFRPFPPEAMSVRAVNPYVNNARHEGPQCVAPPPG